jgi:hypothetical protein
MPIVVVGSGERGALPTPGPVAVIKPAGGQPFALSTAFREFGGLNATPDPNVICIFRRFQGISLVDVRRPEGVTHHFLNGVLGVAAALDENLLLIHDEGEVRAFAADGPRWTSERLMDDELRIRRTDNRRIVCRGWKYLQPSGIEEIEVTLDAATGKLIT